MSADPSVQAGGTVFGSDSLNYPPGNGEAAIVYSH